MIAATLRQDGPLYTFQLCRISVKNGIFHILIRCDEVVDTPYYSWRIYIDTQQGSVVPFTRFRTYSDIEDFLKRNDYI